MNASPPQEEPSIERRLATLERQMAGLLDGPNLPKNWESTVGTWKDDEFSREIDRLGREWRESEND